MPARVGGTSPRSASPSAARCDVARAIGSSTGARSPSCSSASSAMEAEAARLPRHAPDRRRPHRARRCRSPNAASSPHRWTTNGSPTCSRSSPRPNSSASSRGSTSTASSASSTRWSTTTSPTCSARCRRSSARRSSKRWTTTRPRSSPGCCRTRRRTAGGLMTPEMIILGPTATVAEALAELRDPDWTPSIAGQVFITQAPFKPPTGRVPRDGVHAAPAPRAAEHGAAPLPRPRRADRRPDTADRAVFEEFASVRHAVARRRRRGTVACSARVSVDDVVDRMLGAGWRLRHRRQDGALEHAAAAAADGGSDAAADEAR